MILFKFEILTKSNDPENIKMGIETNFEINVIDHKE